MNIIFEYILLTCFPSFQCGLESGHRCVHILSESPSPEPPSPTSSFRNMYIEQFHILQSEEGETAAE